MQRDRGFAALSFVLFPLGVAMLLSGCGELFSGEFFKGPTLHTVKGRLLHAPETFSGETTADIGGNGSISLTSNRGAHCGGPYRQVPDDRGGETRVAESTESGLAILTCTDGRTGKVMFLVGPQQAVGTGMLGKDIVTLTIGG